MFEQNIALLIGKGREKALKDFASTVYIAKKSLTLKFAEGMGSCEETSG
jgi:hypothetical protein